MSQAAKWSLVPNISRNELKWLCLTASAEKILRTGFSRWGVSRKWEDDSDCPVLWWVVLSVLVSHWEVVKLWLQTNRRRHMKHRPIRSLATVTYGRTGQPGCSTPSEGRKNSHQSRAPSGLRTCCTLCLSLTYSTFEFSLAHTVVDFRSARHKIFVTSREELYMAFESVIFSNSIVYL